MLTIPASQPPAPRFVGYRVVRGDTLWRTARLFGTSVAGIQAANRLDSTLIFAGQVLLVPAR